jgi:hypothetical protein
MMRAVLLACAVLSAGLVSGPADARSRERSRVAEPAEPREQQQESREERREDRREQRRQRRDDSADAARRALQRNGGGRVLSVEPQGGGYRVKVIKDGEVRLHEIEGD